MSDKERVSEMESPIEILCADELLLIFSYLDGKSLKNSALVCKCWNDVISESSAIMKNFTLILNDGSDWISRFDEILSLTRRFQSISITLHSRDYMWTYKPINLLVQIAARHGPNIRKLALSNADIENSSDFSSILSCMPLLNEVVLDRMKVDEVDDFTGGNEAFLSKLNKLKISKCYWNIFKFFKSTPIRELQISNDLDFENIQQSEYYMQFLQGSQRLESIEVKSMDSAQTFKTTLDGAICLKLKRLKYWSISPMYDIKNIDSIFGTFLEAQASSLTELELAYVHPTIIKIIFTKLKVLEKLTINGMMLPSESSFYASFKKMPKLKELILLDDISCELAAKEILLNCPNLETFSFRDKPICFVDNILNFMAANNPAVKSLSLNSLPEIISPELKFHHLKFLHVSDYETFENLLQFLNNNPTVETLSLSFDNTGGILDDSTLEALLSHPNIRHLVVAAGYNALNDIYDKVKSDYRNLKSIDLRSHNVKDGGTLIKFPNDKAQWKPKDKIFKYPRNVYKCINKSFDFPVTWVQKSK
ncbi:hypothetical protein Bhyg_03774 [Pseudolycoriella hygida]|uniref:F-box domain-containing protein n=1 Tax=Pseudolycoriella hygida TaxID=35572 RepID=A0A9Q0NFG4_9DIPT|nr:hypothetical protein Bhyg_03774 [Pseudolycoriella hygida]